MSPNDSETDSLLENLDLLDWVKQIQTEDKAAWPKRQDWEGVPFTAGVYIDFDADANKYEVNVHPRKPGLNGTDYKLTSSYSVNIYWDLKLALNFTEKVTVMDGSKKFADAFHNGVKSSEEQADIILSHFGVTDEKRSIGQALRPTFFSGINAYFVQPPAHTVRNIYSKPFNIQKWSMIIIMWVIIGMTLHFLYYLQQTRANEDDNNKLKHSNLNWWLIASPFQQGSSPIPSSISVRLVIFTGLLFSYICCNLFTATIVSDLWTNFIPIKNLDMLLSHSEAIYMSKDSDMSNLVAGGMKQFVPHLLPKVKYHNMSTAFWLLFRGHGKVKSQKPSCLLAWPDHFTGSGRKLLWERKKSYANENVDKTLCARFSSFPYKPFPMKVSMFVRKGSPFTSILNHRILVGLERGVISRHWRQYEMNTKLECVQIKSEAGRVLEMLDIILAFVFLGVGGGISLVMLVGEKVVNSGVKWYHLFQVYQTSSSSDDDEDEDIPKSCGKYAISWIEGILKSTLKCLGGRGSFKMNNIFELVTRASCLLKCTLQEEGAIGDDGILDDVGSALYFEDTFDGPVKDISVPLLQSCFALAEDFNPKEYWCKSYLPFIECCLGAILKGFIPYVGDCIAHPIIGILFSSIKYLTPDSPKVAEAMEEVRSAMQRKTRIKCLNTNCTRMYEYKKVNGTNAVILYNENMEVLSVESKKTKKIGS
ncbi:unnamed protein product [Orchesella dallaii]|uniref:Ionotropic glutamate receptor C-terminal domain-containing protein n=1 Tax=Orchesella dallaii TaxID=48710 RepID=A0ABP1Q0R4_9HEXA